MKRMTVTLTAEMGQAVKGAIATGDYASNSEIVREALRDWQHKRELQAINLYALRSDVQAGLDDIEAGRVQDFDAERIIQKGRQKSRIPSPSK